MKHYIGTVGDFTFFSTEWDSKTGREVFGFEYEGKTHNEYYGTADMAMIAAVGFKYTGPRGAGGENVGTAADWFARMIGMPAAD